MANSFDALSTLDVDNQKIGYYRLDALDQAGLRRVAAAVLAQGPAGKPAAA